MNKHTCLWDDCESTEIFARGLCRRDHMRARRSGRTEEFVAPPRRCFYCEDEFLTQKNGKTKFCALKCQQLYVSAQRISQRIKDLGTRACGECGEPLSLSTRTDSNFCSVTCQQAVWYRANDAAGKAKALAWKAANRDMAKDSEHKRRAAMRGSATGRIDYKAAWERDGGRCWICSEPVNPDLVYPDPRYRSWDHIIPIIRGGPHTMDNIALSHLLCNISKRSKILDHLPEWAS